MFNVCGVYKINSKIHPDRCYIGSSVNIASRFYRHKTELRNKCHHSPILQAHFDKYGMDDLVFSIVAICERDDLIPIDGTIWIEQVFIWIYAHEKHNKERPYFNVDPNAGSRINHKDTDETKKKRHESMLGLKNALGNKLSLETIEKIRIAQIKINESETVRENKREKMKGKNSGKKHSEEAKKKMSEAHKNISDETRKKMSDSKKGVIPWNKGKKLNFTPIGAFKKGRVPWNKGKKIEKCSIKDL